MKQASRSQNPAHILILGMILGFLLVMATPPIGAQLGTAAISGSVRDSTNAVIPDANVKVINTATGSGLTLTTDSAGFYSAEGLPAGVYEVTVSKTGFEQSSTQNIPLAPGQRAAINVTLVVGGNTTQVTVNADAVQVNTETSESGGTVSEKQIGNLMLNGRNFQTLALVVPGVSSTNGADALPGGGLLGGTTLIVNGASTQYTTYSIDGVYDLISGNLADLDVLPVVDGIAQFSVLKDNYSARYGIAGSGQILVETKTGTNTFHGSAWDYLRNNAFDASNYYSTTTQALHQNIFGYTLSGPIVIPHIYNQNRAKKSYFFASNQWYVITAGQVKTGAMFTQPMRSGNFSASPTLPASGALTLDASSQTLLAQEGKANCIQGPTTLNPACFDPVAVAIMNAYMPLPNNPNGGFLNYINQGPLTTRQLDYQYRGDQELTRTNELMARIMYEPVDNGFPYNAFSGDPTALITDTWHTSGFNGLVRLSSAITPAITNTAGIAESYDQIRLKTTKGGKLPSGISITQAFPGADAYNRIPTISLSSGWSGVGVGSEPIAASDGSGILTDDLSWVKGSHVLQAGALYVAGIKRQVVFTDPQGAFSFSGVHTGDPAADYLLGLDSTYAQANSQRFPSLHYRQGEAYAQDDWKATQRLSLNLGLRWVYFSNESASGDQVTSFNAAYYDPSQAPVVNVNGSFELNPAGQPITSSGSVANLLNGMTYAGKNGIPSGFFIPVKTNFGPRVGFAYDFTGKGRTVLRGGYGIGYTREPMENIYDAFGANPPYNLSANILNSLLSNGTAGAPAAPTPQSLQNVPSKFKPSSIQSYSLTLERQLTSDAVLSVAYTGSQSRRLEIQNGSTYDSNSGLPVNAPSTSNCLANGQSPAAHYDFDPCINAGIASESYTRPYLGYSTMADEYNDGTGNYNSVQGNFVYQSSRGLQANIAYTYAKTLTTVGGRTAGTTTSQYSSTTQNMRDVNAEYGPPDYDFRHNLTAAWVYQIPFAHNSDKLAALALGNWSFAGLGVFQSGFALGPGLSTSTNGLATRPNQIAPVKKIGKLSEWFDTSSFVAPAWGFYGDAKNGTIRGPGYAGVNVSLYKTFPIKERLNIEFRAEAFNFINHPNFQGVSTALGSANFGQVTSAGNPRNLEFAMKVFY